MTALKVVIVGVNEVRRKLLVAELSEIPYLAVGVIGAAAQLPGIDALPAVLRSDTHVLIVDLHDDAERGIHIVEAACGLDPTLIVMVYAQADSDLLLRCMRVGAREFLSSPLLPRALEEAMIRASVRREDVLRRNTPAGEYLVFAGSKGGSGVTTIASNFALMLAKESGQSVVVVDMALPLGDLALTLGLSSEFSVMDALADEGRIDSELLTKLIVRHESGLKVLAGPAEYRDEPATSEGVLKLVNTLRKDFAWVVVDAGTRYNSCGNNLLAAATKVFLVTQVGVSELRNANRLITSRFTGDAAAKLEVVLNRYRPETGEIDEAGIARALTVTPAWKVPSDFKAVRTAQNNGIALASRTGPITGVLSQMAKAACGKTFEQTNKKRFGFFR